MMHLSIIVPILNEANALPEMLAHLSNWRQLGCEVILVDGGSVDGSDMLAKTAGFTVLTAPRGRARQMNAGAQVANGDALLFLHADTRLPEDAQNHVLDALASNHYRESREANTLNHTLPLGESRSEGTVWRKHFHDQGRRLRHDGYVWGRFDVIISGDAWMLKLVSFMMNIRSRLTGIATGDQAIFVLRSQFEAMGGFPDIPLMEDIELSKRLKQKSKPASLKARVITSGRRWESHGVFKTIWLMWRLRWAYWRGVSPEKLAKAYR